MAMKTVKIEYEEVNLETPEMMIMSVSIDKDLRIKRKLFLYELAECEGLNDKFNKYLDSDKYLKSNTYLSPIMIKLNDKEYAEVSQYFSTDTIYEEIIFSEDYKFLNAKMSLLKQDPKFWET